MKIKRFEIQNFRGVERTEIRISDEIPGNIITLIGLNESGKTTVLEAISHFITEDEETASLVKTVHQKSSPQEIIPKHMKAAFTGNSVIVATLELIAEDKESLRKHALDKHKLILDVGRLPAQFSVERRYAFEDSSHKFTRSVWSTTFHLKSMKAKSFKHYDASVGENRSIWISLISHIRSRIPAVVYFPTFLFDFPDRIYLEGNDEGINPYYKQILQDVLESLGEGLSVERHIVDRIRKHRENFDNPASFFAQFFSLDEKSQVDAVMAKISNEISRVVFGAWNEIFSRSTSNKRVQVDWLLDSDRGNVPYAQVYIIDGQSRYALSERSLGFRWFFSFLLFTQFRVGRGTGSGTIFLFDEPAANLHSKAQMKLLESFNKIASENTYIVYSTHSHYMVNPDWLEKAYIIDNKAIDYDDDDQIESFAVRKTNIKAIRYRQFVATHPTRTTYFQPVLDALDVGFSPLEQSARAIIIEGKFDYQPMKFILKRAKIKDNPLIFPANGAGDVSALVNLFRGWGVDFRIIFDGDKAGRDGRARCLKDNLLLESEAVSLSDVDPNLHGKVFEDLYGNDVRTAAANHFSVASAEKRHLSLYFHELNASGSKRKFPETETLIRPIADWISLSFS